MSDNALDKFRKERGIDPNLARGLEISELYDAEAVSEAEAALAAAADTYPPEQNIVEFYNPFDTAHHERVFAGSERSSLIPGVRFPKLGTIAEQDFSNFLTIPANIAIERERLGGSILEFNRPYDPSDQEVTDIVTKYGLSGNERTIGKLLDASSPEDLEAQAKVYARREQREEQIAIDNPGLLGLATRIGTNVLDPSFILAGSMAGSALTVRVANSATKTGAAIRFASDGLTKAERFRIGAGVSLAVDVPLEAANTVVDPSRDILMSAGFVALSPLVGGTFGLLGRTKADDLAEAAVALDEAVAKGIRGTDGGAGGAAQSGSVPFTFPEEDLPGAPPRANKFTVGTPLNFLARSADNITRTLADKLSWNPNTRSKQGVTAAEAQRRIYNSQAIRMRAGRMAAKEYFNSKGFQPTTAQLDDFFRQVGQHIAGARVSEDPAILRAVESYREGFAEMLAHVRDKDFVPGRARPGPYTPTAAPPAGSAAAPNAPTPPPAAPPSAPPVAPVVAPEAPTPAPRAPDPVEAPEPNAPVQSAQAPDVTGINPEAPKGTARDYFGRKSFRSAEPEKAPEVAPVVAETPPPVADEGIVEAPKPTDRTPPTVANIPEKVAQVKAATSKVIEAAPSGLPTRTDLRRALQGYVEAAEAIAFEGADVPLEIVEAAAQGRRYVEGASLGTNKMFEKKYLDALDRLSRALEDAPDGSPASQLLASIVDDLDSGFASKLQGDGPVLARRPDRDAMAATEVDLNETAAAYDKFLAEVQYTGKGKRPVAAKDAVAMAAVLGTGAAAATWLADAEPSTIAGLGLFGAAVGTAFGVASGRSRARTWDKTTPGVGLFLGANSKGADLKALKKAEALEAKGTDRDTIWQQTGWGRDPEGKWFFEADQPLGEFVDDLLDPTIFGRAFKGERIVNIEPDLRNIILQNRTQVQQLKQNGWDGSAFPDKWRAAVDASKLNRAQKLRVMLHEINHVLQGKRKMGMVDPSAMDARAEAYRQQAEELYQELQLMIRQGETSGPDFDQLSADLAEAEKASDDFYQYLTAGIEAESRLVEKRLGYSFEQRRQTPPWKDYDVPEEDVWAGQGATIAASLGSDLKMFRSDAYWAENVEIGEFADGEVQGYQYAKVGTGPNAIYSWVEEAGGGEGIINWDWARNIEGNTLFADNLAASPAESARAFAFAQAATERVLKSGEFDLVTFEGVKKAAPGRDASGHERVQKFLMARGQTDGYVPTMGTWKTKVKDPKTGDMVEATRSSFAFVREGLDVTEAWQNIRRGKVEIEVIEKKVPAGEKMAAKKTTGGAPEAEPEDTYRGLEEWRYIEEDPAYLPRRFNKQGWDRVFLSPEFRGNTNKLGNRIGDTLYRSNQKRFDEIGAAKGVTGQEIAWRVGRKYAETVKLLMNPARGQKNPYRKVTPDDREAAKEIVRDVLNDGNDFAPDQEEAMEMLLDLVAPIKKKSAESARARPRLEMNLDAEADADIIDMFEWNVESLFTAYSRNLSGYAGLLKSGFRSEAEVRGEIEKIRAQSDRDPKRQRRAEREAEMLELMLDAIIGRPPEDLMGNRHWTWFANQLRRLNFGNLMNNTGFLALSEVGAALTRVNIVRMVSMFPEFQRYYKLARAGDPAVRDNIYYLADATMGHGSAQVRSRLASMNDAVPGDAPSLENRPMGVFDKIDRFTRKQANLVARFSGMSPIQEFLRMTIVTAEAQDWVKAARNGKPIYSARRMAALGVDAPMWQRISAQLKKWGDVTSPDSMRQVPNMDLQAWDDGEALNVWLNAIDRNANRLVMEGDVGHQAFWLRNRPSGQLLFQFLNFPMNAFSKHLGFAMRTADARVGMEMLAMSMGGMAGYLARVYAQGYAQDTEEERVAYISERATYGEAAKAFFYYGAHYSLAPNAVDFALYLGNKAGMPNPIPGYEGEAVSPLFTKTRASGLPGDPFTGNPSYSRFLSGSQNGALAKLTDPIKGTPFSEQDVHGLIKHFAPLGNHIALNALLDRVLEFLPDEEGSVEDQVQN